MKSRFPVRKLSFKFYLGLKPLTIITSPQGTSLCNDQLSKCFKCNLY